MLSIFRCCFQDILIATKEPNPDMVICAEWLHYVTYTIFYTLLLFETATTIMNIHKKKHCISDWRCMTQLFLNYWQLFDFATEARNPSLFGALLVYGHLFHYFYGIQALKFLLRWMNHHCHHCLFFFCVTYIKSDYLKGRSCKNLVSQCTPYCVAFYYYLLAGRRQDLFQW